MSNLNLPYLEEDEEKEGWKWSRLSCWSQVTHTTLVKVSADVLHGQILPDAHCHEVLSGESFDLHEKTLVH